MATKARRVIGYVRVSVDRDEKVSPDMQREAIAATCTAKGWQLVDVIEDRGRSGGEGKKRPGLERARAMIDAGAANVLMVWKLDRVARSVRDFAEMWSELRDQGAEFVSVTESFDTSTSIGRAMVQITSVFAELERERAVERTNGWHGYRVANGMTPTAKAPIGYRKNGRNDLQLDPATTPLVQQAAADILGGQSIRSVARRLTEQGVSVTHFGLARAMVNPTMVGMRDVDGVLVLGGWPAIFDMETHRQLVAFFDDPSRNVRPDRNGRRWLLSGLASCSCGSPMRAKPHTQGTRYSCPKCYKSVRADLLDDYVTTVILGTLDAETWQAMRTRSTTSVPVDIATVEAELADLATRWASGDLLRVEWDAARATLLARLEEPVSDEQHADLPDVDDLVEAWPGLDVDARRLVVVAVLEDIVVEPAPKRGPCPVDDRVKLTWRS